MAKQKPAEHDPATIVPRIKHTEFVKALKKMKIPDDQMPVTEPLVADLLVTYAFDLPDLFQMVTHADLKKMSIAPADLRELAIDNMRRGHPGIRIEEQGPFLRVITGGDLEACTLLSVKFWNDVAEKVPTDFVVIVPSREIVLIAIDPNEAALQFLREVIADVREAERVHCLSESLLTWRDGAWAVYS